MSKPKSVPTTVLPSDAHPSITRQAYYARLCKGWDLDRAKSEPAHRSPSTPFEGMVRGRSLGFRLPKEWEPEYLAAVAESGLTASDWVAIAVGEKLRKQSP
jgi:hypothetical protein